MRAYAAGGWCRRGRTASASRALPGSYVAPVEYVRDNAEVPRTLGSVLAGVTEGVNATVYNVFIGPQFTTNAQRAMHRLGLSKRVFNRAIHNIKKQVEGNQNMVFNVLTGDIYDQRAGEWIGNLLDGQD